MTVQGPVKEQQPNGMSHGGSIELPKTGGGGGSGKRAQLTGLLIGCYELWRQRHRNFFLKMVKQFSPNIWQMMTFLNPLDALIPKPPISSFCQFLGLGHLRGPGVSLGGPVN